MQNKNFKISFKRKYAVSDLEKFISAQRSKSDIEKKLCSIYKILIIDDEINDDVKYPFRSDINFLKNQKHCDITTKIDLENLADASGYDIIISDNIGVGKLINERRGNGILLINQLKELYPDKIYVLCSGQQSEIVNINRIKAIAKLWDKDDLNDKSRNNNEFANRVLEIMNDNANPSKKWESVRTQLLDSGVSIHSVAALESAYVKSIIKEQPDIYEKAKNKIDVTNDKNIDVSDLIMTSGVSFIKLAIKLFFN